MADPIKQNAIRNHTQTEIETRADIRSTLRDSESDELARQGSAKQPGSSLASRSATASTVAGGVVSRVDDLLKEVAETALPRATGADRIAAEAARLRRLGQHTGRALTVLSAASTAVEQYGKSPAQTVAGKVADGATAAALTTAFSSAMPGIAAVDAATGGHASQHLSGTASAATALAEGVVTGDSGAAERFHAEALRGAHGAPLEWAAEAGDYWADDGIADGLRNAYRELKSRF